MYRAKIGEFVRNRLAHTPGAFRLPVKELDIFIVRSFLTAEECAGLIRLIDADRQPSCILSDHPDPGFRTSESCNLDPNDPLVRSVEDKVGALMGIQRTHGETVQGQRYAVGQEFKAHHDFFYTNQRYWEKEAVMGGQRTWTAMMFLNEPDEGGQTGFPKVNLKVGPKTGNLLAWNNLDSNGEPNLYSLHQGMPVIAGVKYIITKWYRERPWAVPAVLLPAGASPR